MPEPVATPDPELLARLDALEAESNARRAELRRLATELPAAVSRRAMLTALVRDLRNAPDKGEVAVRALRKLGRAPRAVLKRVRRSVS